MYDLLVKGGTIIDGTSAPRFFGDIAIKDGVIERIASMIPETQAKQVIDATGKIVAPGVVDGHTHYDAQFFWDPYATNSGWHGVTTVAVGNCGFGFAPCKPDEESRNRIIKMMEHTEQIAVPAMRAGLPWNWESLPDFLQQLGKLNKGVNVAMYMPINPLMAYVMGLDEAKKRAPTEAEMQQMKDLLNESMDAGAIGFAFSWQGEETNHVDFDGSLMPSDAMDIEVAYSLADVLAERGHGSIQVNCTHTGYQDNSHIIEELARRSRGRILFNSISLGAQVPPEEMYKQLDWLDDMESKGLNVYAQSTIFRPWIQFTALTTNHFDPVKWMREFCVASPEKQLELCADEQFRDEIKGAYNPKDLVTAGGSFEFYKLVDPKSEKYAQYSGHPLGDIAEAACCHVTEVFFEVIAESKGEAIFSLSSQNDDAEIMAKLMNHKRAIAGTSDGGAHSKFWAGGYYPTDAIKWFTRETNAVDLEVVHHHLSQIPARALGLHKRGILVEGHAADMFIYDHDKIDYASQFEVRHDQPGDEWRVVITSKGIEWTIVNGEPTLHGMEPTGAYSGRVLSNGGAALDEKLAS